MDAVLSSSDFSHLLQIADVQCDNLFANDVLSTQRLHSGDGNVADSVLRKDGLETDLCITHANIIAHFQKAMQDLAQYVCCSCQLLFRCSAVTIVKFSDNLGSVWSTLQDYLLKSDPEAAEKTHYV